MAVEWASEDIKRAGALYVAFPEDITIVEELNGRHDPTDIEALAADIEANDQHTPVGLRKNDDGQPVLVYGHRRWEAVALLNKKYPHSKRKLVGTYLSVDENGAFIAAISENRFRKDVSPIDDCANINTLRKRLKFADEDIAKVYFPEAKSKEELAAALRFVKQRGSLIELAPEAATAVREGKVKVTAAVRLAKLSKNLQREKLKEQPAKMKAKDVPAPKPKRESIPATMLPLVKKAIKDLLLKDLENTQYPYVEVKREPMLALYRLINPS
jgi:ParB-like chromosome segregation protein Spo0J